MRLHVLSPTYADGANIEGRHRRPKNGGIYPPVSGHVTVDQKPLLYLRQGKSWRK